MDTCIHIIQRRVVQVREYSWFICFFNTAVDVNLCFTSSLLYPRLSQTTCSNSPIGNSINRLPHIKPRRRNDGGGYPPVPVFFGWGKGNSS